MPKNVIPSAGWNGSRYCVLSAATFACTLALASSAYAVDETTGDLVARVADAESRRDAQVEEIRSVRHYVLRNPRWSKDATMDVRVIYSGGKKRYEILQMSADGIPKQVFHKLLEGEVESAMRKDRDGAVTPELYEMKPIGTDQVNGRPCRSVELIPKKRTKFTIEGRACVDMQDLAVVRIEGRTAKSVSFWVGRPYLVQEFRKVGNVWLSSQNRSVADVRFLGNTELTIQYGEYSVVPKRGGVMMACTGTCTAAP